MQTNPAPNMQKNEDELSRPCAPSVCRGVLPWGLKAVPSGLGDPSLGSLREQKGHIGFRV